MTLGNYEEMLQDDNIEFVCGHYEKHTRKEHFCLCGCCKREK